MISTNIYLVIFAVMLSCCGGNEGNPDSPVTNPDESVVFIDDFSIFDGSVWTKESHKSGWINKVCFLTRDTCQPFFVGQLTM